MIDALISRWVRFWFLTDGRQQVGLFRKIFGATMIFFVISRSADLELFYGEKGMVPISAFPDLMDAKYRYTLFEFFTSNTAIWIGHILLLAALLMLVLGVFPRISAFVAFVLNVSFIHRNLAVAYGVDVIANFYLFYLCFADPRPRAPAEPDFQSMLGSLAYRLSQIQICIIYAYSGLEKVRGGSWWNGEALWYVFSNSQLARMDMTWISHYPGLIAFFTYATLAWEIYFPVLIWVKGARPFMIFAGIMLHLGIAVQMNLAAFGILMISMYVFFLEAPTAQRVTEFARKIVRFRKVSLKPADEFYV